jgi:hypothetical protein
MGAIVPLGEGVGFAVKPKQIFIPWTRFKREFFFG